MWHVGRGACGLPVARKWPGWRLIFRKLACRGAVILRRSRRILVISLRVNSAENPSIGSKRFFSTGRAHCRDPSPARRDQDESVGGSRRGGPKYGSPGSLLTRPPLGLADFQPTIKMGGPSAAATCWIPACAGMSALWIRTSHDMSFPPRRSRAGNDGSGTRLSRVGGPRLQGATR